MPAVLPAVRPDARATLRDARGTVTREHRGQVMGTDLHVVAVGSPEAADGALVRAAARLALLEARWSRFRPTSEPSRAAAAAGGWVDVSDDTVRLVSAGLAAWERTGGRCDPTGGAAIAAAGYDRDLAERRAAGAAPARPARPFPGPDAVTLDVTARRLRLAPGAVLDAGAIGKGLAADLVVEEVFGGAPTTDRARSSTGIDGLDGLLVNVGGDLRAAGAAPAGGAWGVDVALHDPAGSTLRWSLTAGAVATSSSRRRVWDTTAGPAHHVLDPRTGAPATDVPALVSVHAGAAWWAEAAATALMLLAPEERATWVDASGVAAVVVEADGAVVRIGDVAGRLA